MEVEGEGPFVHICVTPPSSKGQSVCSLTQEDRPATSHWEQASGWGTWASTQMLPSDSSHADVFIIKKLLHPGSEFSQVIPSGFVGKESTINK